MKPKDFLVVNSFLVQRPESRMFIFSNKQLNYCIRFVKKLRSSGFKYYFDPDCNFINYDSRLFRKYNFVGIIVNSEKKITHTMFNDVPEFQQVFFTSNIVKVSAPIFQSID